MKRFGLIILSACLLQACETRTDLAPVFSANEAPQLEEVKNEHELQAQTTYEVLPGENLYTIAKRFGMNYHDLAVMNDIEKPYYIHAGQVLLISRYDNLKPQVKAPGKQKFDFHTAATTKPAVTKPAKTVKTTQNSHTPLPMATSADWIWPVRQGYVAQAFSAHNKGMDIGVIKTQQVVAASAGTVVYAGVNLTGDDELVIVKHPKGYLTAYSSKMTVVVHEGESVKIGQKLASIKPSTKNLLHFDLRSNGKSVNPMGYVTEKS